MNISKSLNNLRKLLNEQAPVVLTAMAVTGAGITAYLAARGGYQARAHLEDHPDDINEMTTGEKFIHTYKFYAPAAVTLAGTATCMVLATKIGLDRTAALAGALVITERANDQYKGKVKELLGVNKETKVNDAVATDQVNASSIPQHVIIKDGQQLFYDRRNGRFFATTRNELDHNVNLYNRDLTFDNYKTLNDFYKQIGMDDVQDGDDVGFNKKYLVELVYTSVLKDNQAVQAFGFEKAPMPDFQDDWV